MKIAILGGGSFGSALAAAFSQDHKIAIWARTPREADQTSDMAAALSGAEMVLSVVPLQSTAQVLELAKPHLFGQPILCCSKGIDLKTFTGGFSTTRLICPDNPAGVLTGPSFADDIKMGLPTAVTLASDELDQARAWQAALSTASLRIYASADPTGAELGGALKNVMAIACGAAIGAGLGESARAALITRGYAEMQRYALACGALPETLAGLSGFGDLCLTATSQKSRNYRYGLSIGRAESFDSATTVEGRATALAMANIAKREGHDMPITQVVAQLSQAEISVEQALETLMNRPLRKEN